MKYCGNCGNELKENTKCLKCGGLENNQPNVMNKTKKGFTIAGFVFSIITVWTGLNGLLLLGQSSTFFDMFGLTSLRGTVVGAISFILGDLLYITLALVFTLIGRKEYKHGMNVAALILSGVGVLLIILQIIIFLN